MGILTDLSTYPRSRNLDAALRALELQIEQILVQLEEINRSFFVKSYSPPDKPRELMIRFADGTLWNPGQGQGLYQFVGGSWVKL